MTKTSKVFEELFHGQHNECLFDAWSKGGKVKKYISTHDLMIGGGESDMTIVKMRFHCKTCIKKHCIMGHDRRQKHDLFLRESVRRMKYVPK